jgi:hypothetical protein
MSLAQIGGVQLAHRRQHAQEPGRARVGVGRGLGRERRQPLADRLGQVAAEQDQGPGLGRHAAGGRLGAVGLEDRAGIVPQRPVRRAEPGVGQLRRGLALAVGGPVQGQEHLPGIEVELALDLGELLGLLQLGLQRDVDVARHLRRQLGREVGEGGQIGRLGRRRGVDRLGGEQPAPARQAHQRRGQRPPADLPSRSRDFHHALRPFRPGPRKAAPCVMGPSFATG